MRGFEPITSKIWKKHALGQRKGRAEGMIIVFAGSGASKAVGGINFLTTPEFFDYINKSEPEIVQNWLYQKIIHSLSNEVIKADYDVEEVLTAIYESIDTLDALIKNKCLSQGILKPNNLYAQPKPPSLGVQHSELDSYYNTMIGLEPELKELEEKITSLIWKLYGHEVKTRKLKVWDNFLRELLEEEFFSIVENNVQVFTTNYDLLLDQVVEDIGDRKSLGATNTHRGSNAIDNQNWYLHENFRKAGIIKSKIFFTKLHGSINWEKDGDQIIVGSKNIPSNRDHRILLYPGTKGYPQEEPFNSFYMHLEAMVKDARAAIFIGVAFRDEAITKIVSKLKCPVFSINPAPAPQGLFDNLIQLKTRFNPPSSIKALASIKKEILNLNKTS